MYFQSEINEIFFKNCAKPRTRKRKCLNNEQKESKMSTKVAKAPKTTAAKPTQAKVVAKVSSKASDAKTASVRLSEEDKKADTANYIFNPNTEKYVKRDTPLGKKLVKAEETGEEVPKTMTETERLILVVQTLVDHGVEDSFVKAALSSIEKELPRGFPVVWGGKQKTVRSPDHPKQPSNAYIFYTKAVRQSIKEANPGLNNTELVSLMAKMWNDTTEEDRAEYNELAAQDKARYDREMEVFEREHPDQARAKSSPGKPTKATAYHKYCETHREDLKAEHPDLDGKAITKLLADQWEEVKKDKDEEAKYQALADEANEGFEDRVIEYHETNGSKKLSEAEQKKANDPDNYELNPKTGRYVEKEKPKKEPKEPEVKETAKPAAKKAVVATKQTAKPATKPVTAKPKALKTVAESVTNDEVEQAEETVDEAVADETVEVEKADEDVLVE